MLFAEPEFYGMKLLGIWARLVACGHQTQMIRLHISSYTFSESFLARSRTQPRSLLPRQSLASHPLVLARHQQQPELCRTPSDTQVSTVSPTRCHTLCASLSLGGGPHGWPAHRSTKSHRCVAYAPCLTLSSLQTSPQAAATWLSACTQPARCH